MRINTDNMKIKLGSDEDKEEDHDEELMSIEKNKKE